MQIDIEQIRNYGLKQVDNTPWNTTQYITETIRRTFRPSPVKYGVWNEDKNKNNRKNTNDFDN